MMRTLDTIPTSALDQITGGLKLPPQRPAVFRGGTWRQRFDAGVIPGGIPIIGGMPAIVAWDGKPRPF